MLFWGGARKRTQFDTHLFAKNIAAGKFDKPKAITKLSEYIMNQQNRTFAHVVRADQQDPMKQVTVPRIPWIHANSKWLYEKDHVGTEYNHDLEEHREWVKTKCGAGW